MDREHTPPNVDGICIGEQARVDGFDAAFPDTGQQPHDRELGGVPDDAGQEGERRPHHRGDPDDRQPLAAVTEDGQRQCREHNDEAAETGDRTEGRVRQVERVTDLRAERDDRDAVELVDEVEDRQHGERRQPVRTDRAQQ